MEETSGLRSEEDFYLAFAYERVMVGRLIYNILNYPRIVGGVGPKSSKKTIWIYKQVLKNDIIPTTALTAELAKVVENTYRDVNVAFANEVTLVCESLGVDVYKVRKLVNTLPFIEGKGNPYRNMHITGAGVGGHCLPKDPWLLKYGVTQYGKKPVHLRVIEASRYRNINMSLHVVSLLEECLVETNRQPSDRSELAVLGGAFLENSDDPRNTPTRDLIHFLDTKNYHYVFMTHMFDKERWNFPFQRI